SRRHELPHWRWASLRYRSRPSGFALNNLDVPAWLLDAFIGEYVVPVALRQQCRRFYGTAALLCLLHPLWAGGGDGTGSDESQLGASDGGRLGSHQRGLGRFLGLLSEGPRFRVGILWFFCDFGGSARLDDARLLVAHSVYKRISGLWWRRGRCSILGACRRVCGWGGAGGGVFTGGLNKGWAGGGGGGRQNPPGVFLYTRNHLLPPIPQSHHLLPF